MSHLLWPSHGRDEGPWPKLGPGPESVHKRNPCFQLEDREGRTGRGVTGETSKVCRIPFRVLLDPCLTRSKYRTVPSPHSYSPPTLPPLTMVRVEVCFEEERRPYRTQTRTPEGGDLEKFGFETRWSDREGPHIYFGYPKVTAKIYKINNWFLSSKDKHLSVYSVLIKLSVLLSFFWNY